MLTDDLNDGREDAVNQDDRRFELARNSVAFENGRQTLLVESFEVLRRLPNVDDLYAVFDRTGSVQNATRQLVVIKSKICDHPIVFLDRDSLPDQHFRDSHHNLLHGWSRQL